MHYLLSILVLFLAADVSLAAEGKTWAFLAATSNGWINYRHQADVCHAYQLLINNGIPAENIVTMFYDDIAHNEENKNPGVIINRPGGPNVYKGVKKDYTGQEVTVENFFNILSGNKEAMKGIGSGRVIESGPDDHVFVYVVDHGDTGMLLFLDDEYLYAHNLTQQLRQMKRNNHFKKMLMYIEACKAGSMFDNIIDDNLKVLVTTASATDEFSWARYCDTLDTCLGDYYSTTWMEKMDEIRENWSAKYTSVFKQFKTIRTNVVKSHVEMYGDFSLGFDEVSSFLGDNWDAKKTMFNVVLSNSDSDNSLVSVDELPVYHLRSKIDKSQNEETKDMYREELRNLMQKRETLVEVMNKIIKSVTKSDLMKYKNIMYTTKPSMKEEHYPCYEAMIRELNTYCFNTYKNPYITQHFFKLANLCIMGYSSQDLIPALKQSCNKSHRFLTNVS